MDRQFNDSEKEIADAIRKEIERDMADNSARRDQITDISKAVESKAASAVYKTDYAESVSKSVVDNVSQMDTDEFDALSSNITPNPESFLPDIDDDNTDYDDMRIPYRESRPHPTGNYRLYDKASGRSGTLWDKFKRQRLSTQITIAVGIFAILALLVFILWIIYGDRTPAPLPHDEPVIATPAPPPAVQATVRSLSIISGGSEVTSADIHVGDSAVFTAIADIAEFDDEILWTSSRLDIAEITSIRSGGAEVTITGLATGTTRLTASVGNVETVIIIRVGDVPLVHAESVQITHNGTVTTEAEVYIGHNINFWLVIDPSDFDDNIIVSSSNPGVLSVSANDQEFTVTGVAAGTATVVVYVGQIRTEATFIVSVEYIEVPHPFNTALRDFLAEHGSHAILVSDMYGTEGDVVLASTLLNPPNFEGASGQPNIAYRFMYMQNDNLRTQDFNSFFGTGGGAIITANNYLASVWSEDTRTVYSIHLFNGGQLQVDSIVFQALNDGRFFYNDVEISGHQFDAFLTHYGLDRTINHPSDISTIFEMTEIVPAPQP